MYMLCSPVSLSAPSPNPKYPYLYVLKSNAGLLFSTMKLMQSALPETWNSGKELQPRQLPCCYQLRWTPQVHRTRTEAARIFEPWRTIDPVLRRTSLSLCVLHPTPTLVRRRHQGCSELPARCHQYPRRRWNAVHGAETHT